MKFEVNYKTIERVAGPLVIVGKVGNAAYNEIVKVKLGDRRDEAGTGPRDDEHLCGGPGLRAD